jgi:hypothetical protein
VSLDLGEQVQRLGAGQRRPQVRLAGDVGEASVRLDRLAMTVESEDLTVTTAGNEEAEQETDQRCLAGSVGTQAANDFADSYVELQVAQRLRVTKVLRECERSNR